MTKNQTKAHELYAKILDKTKVSENFLYNSICYFDLYPELVVEMLNELPAEECEKLDSAFQTCREQTKKVLDVTLETGNFSKIFHEPEVEDILFYQNAHGEPIH